jgi:hypothetical protein
MSAVITLAEAFTKMPNLREVKCVLVPTLSHETTGYPPFSCLMLVAHLPGCSLADNNLTNFGTDTSAVIKLAEAFTKMPDLRKVK